MLTSLLFSDTVPRAPYLSTLFPARYTHPSPIHNSTSTGNKFTGSWSGCFCSLTWLHRGWCTSTSARCAGARLPKWCSCEIQTHRSRRRFSHVSFPAHDPPPGLLLSFDLVDEKKTGKAAPRSLFQGRSGSWGEVICS